MYTAGVLIICRICLVRAQQTTVRMAAITADRYRLL